MITKKRGPLSGYGFLPPGGVEGDVLTKRSHEDGDADWVPDIEVGSEYIRVKGLGAVADGSEANAETDTAAVTAALEAARDHYGAQIVFEHGDYVMSSPIAELVSGLKLIGDGATLRGANGVRTIIASFSSGNSGEDVADNSQLLGGLGLRTITPGSLEDVVIRGISFRGGNATRAIHGVGFTRGCSIEYCDFENFSEYDLIFNGSFSMSFIKNRCNGSNNTGTALGLGIIGEGRRDADNQNGTACNAIDAQGNWFGRHQNGSIWNYGAGGNWIGNTFERNGLDGFRSQSVKGLKFMGNYLEQNSNDNAQFGGTNGDTVSGAVIAGNTFGATTGTNIRLNAITNSVIGPNNFTGQQTRHYHIGTNQNTANVIWVPVANSTYVSSLSNLDQSVNKIVTTASLARATVNGSRGGNTALANLLTQLATLNIIVDGTSA